MTSQTLVESQTTGSVGAKRHHVADAALRLPSAVPGTIRKRLVRGISWTVLGGIVTQGTVFLNSVIVARILGRQLYGEFAMIQSTIVALTCLAGMGLGITATKYVSEYRSTDPKEVGEILGLSVLTATVAALAICVGLQWFAPTLSVHSDESGPLTLGLRFSIPYIFFMTVNGYQAGALAGFEAFRCIARIGAIHGLSSLTMTWLLTSRYGFLGAIAAQGSAAMLLWGLSHAALSSECRNHRVRVCYRSVWARRSVLLRTSLPSAASGIIGAVATWWCNAHLVESSGYAALAIFSVVSTMRSMVMFLPVLIMRVTAPLLNNMMTVGDLAGFSSTLRQTVGLNGGVAVLLSALLVLGGRQVTHLFGKEFTGSTLLITLVLASVVFEVLANSLFQSLFATGHLWWNLGIVGMWASILIFSVHLATPRWGTEGLAFSYLVAWCASTAIYASTWKSAVSERMEGLCIP